MEETLRRLGTAGPFFTVRCGAEPPSGGGFRTLAELYGGGPVLAGYVAEVGRRMGGAEPRVAASTLQFGLAARMWSLGLGAVALSGLAPDLDPVRVWWRLPEGSSVELWLPEPGARPGEELGETVLRHLAVLEQALRVGYRVPLQTLRGNSASGLVGALRELTKWRPDTERAAAGVVAGLLADGPLAGTGTFVHEEGLGVAFVRRSCCLYYRAPGGGLCGDCVLRTRQRTGRQN
ncbi:Fe-S oxidoreductase [Streptomyces venezuelae]|uniref:Fe-S oxidoreductase n=1 Tax=Streptomyces venezuelae TaxID=54571 RepID=A0A5P2CVB3_STRVZ|nr:(2Fe-2S)-binding protein [Streptomyces venezuelae]QES46842.1 Fe-S oxidoreductase [Streptomyces venezuelae]